MIVSQASSSKTGGWAGERSQLAPGEKTDLVLVFGATALMKDPAVMAEISRAHPTAYVCGCSTAGEIAGTRVNDDTVVVTTVKFVATKIRGANTSVKDAADSFAAGERLAGAIPSEHLSHVFVLSDGLSVNGSELVQGITSVLPKGVALTGGLAGDGARFGETLVCANGVCAAKQIMIVGFYGDRLKVGYGSMGGWDSFGPERRVTRSRNNVLYELDGRSALDLYKTYLGEHAAGLPATGLLFPLSIRQDDASESLVRTILSVNEKDQSMTFAGDVPEGSLARLMRANFDRLVDGANGAARKSRLQIGDTNTELAILISCVGRKLVLQQRVEEEVEAVADVLGSNALTTGFYSYGEISPFTPEARCALHNQTMTITTFSEAA
jgi:hypothetical protein